MAGSQDSGGRGKAGNGAAEGGYLVGAVQAVDTANHSWANYFLAAYKVRCTAKA